MQAGDWVVLINLVTDELEQDHVIGDNDLQLAIDDAESGDTIEIKEGESSYEL